MTEANANVPEDDVAAEFLDGRTIPSATSRGGVVAVGNFDGVHLGHAALVKTARELAGIVGGPVVAVTFDPHPLKLLAPDRFQPPLTTLKDRARFLHQVGVDAVVILRTTPELLKIGPVDFFRNILVGQFQARGIVEGFNFRFGHERAGTLELLEQLCGDAGIAFRVVDPFQLNGDTVSSSRVRDAIAAGDVSTAAALINRYYKVMGTVGTGAKRGRAIGFPTANLESVETLLPADGVYAVRGFVDGQTYPGAANIGPNPTFGENARKVEVHLIGFSGNLYGRPLSIEFMERLRLTRRFNNVEDLVEQLRYDVERAKQIAGQ